MSWRSRPAFNIRARSPGPLILCLSWSANTIHATATLRCAPTPSLSRAPRTSWRSTTQAERDAVTDLLDLQYRWRRRDIAIGFKRPLFDIASRIGPIRPDLVLDIRDDSTGELIEAAIEVIAKDDPDYLDAKQRKIAALAELGPTVFTRAATIRDHGMATILKANLGIG